MTERSPRLPRQSSPNSLLEEDSDAIYEELYAEPPDRIDASEAALVPADNPPTADDSPFTEHYDLSGASLLLASDPAALRTFIDHWPAATQCGAGSPTFHEPGLSSIDPVIQAIAIAGYFLQRDDDPFATDDWTGHLRKALKLARSSHVHKERVRNACDWLLRDGLPHIVPDADGFNEAAGLSVDRRADMLRRLLVDDFLIPTFNWTEPTAENISALAKRMEQVSEITLVRPGAQPEKRGNKKEFQPFPVYLLPPTVAEFVSATAASKSVDPAMVALPSLAMLGAAIGTTRQIAAKDDWQEYPIVWSAVVAESGERKTPAFKAVTDPLHALQAAAHADYQVKLANFNRTMKAAEAAKTNPNPEDDDTPRKWASSPRYQHLLTTDTTVEAIGKILETADRGLAILKDELSDFVGSLNAYKKGGNDVAKYLEMFNGGGIKIDRKTQDPLYIPRAAVWISGAIQPSVLWQHFEKQQDNGFLARFLLAYPPRGPGQWTDAIVPPSVCQGWAGLIAKLRALEFASAPADENDFQTATTPVVISLDPEARLHFISFYEATQKRITALKDPPLRAAWAKMHGYCLKFALIDHLVRQAESDVAATGDNRERVERPVSADSMDRATRLAEWFMNETERIYAMQVEMSSEATKERQKLLDFIERHGGRTTARKVAENCRWCHRSSQLAEEALNGLEEDRLGRWDKRGQRQEFVLFARPEEP